MSQTKTDRRYLPKMKKMTLVMLVLYFTFSLVLLGQQQLEHDKTGNMFNCRFWMRLSVESRSAYLLGVGDGFEAGLATSEETQKRYTERWARYFPKGRTTAEVERGLDAFCSAAENAIVPIVHGLQVVTMKANGADPTEVETRAAFLRRVATEIQENEEKGSRDFSHPPPN